MTIKAMVLSEVPDEYTGKRGLVKSQVLNLLDAEPGINRLAQTMQYTLTEEEKLKYSGKLDNKVIALGVRQISLFGAFVRVRGQIVSVEGLK
jgi:hypothetical protein